jgi:hypothetical protein
MENDFEKDQTVKLVSFKILSQRNALESNVKLKISTKSATVKKAGPKQITVTG